MKRISNWWEVEPYYIEGQAYLSRWNEKLVEIIIDDTKVKEVYLYTEDDFLSWDKEEVPIYVERVHDSNLIAKLDKEATILVKKYETD